MDVIETLIEIVLRLSAKTCSFAPAARLVHLHTRRLARRLPRKKVHGGAPHARQVCQQSCHPALHREDA